MSKYKYVKIFPLMTLEHLYRYFPFVLSPIEYIDGILPFFFKAGVLFSGQFTSQVLTAKNRKIFYDTKLIR
jgi:hypothetical protein